MVFSLRQWYTQAFIGRSIGMAQICQPRTVFISVFFSILNDGLMPVFSFWMQHSSNSSKTVQFKDSECKHTNVRSS